MRLFVARSPNFRAPSGNNSRQKPPCRHCKVVEARSEQVPSIGRDLISVDGSFQKLLALVSELAPLRAIDRTGCPASHTPIISALATLADWHRPFQLHRVKAEEVDLGPYVQRHARVLGKSVRKKFGRCYQAGVARLPIFPGSPAQQGEHSYCATGPLRVQGGRGAALFLLSAGTGAGAGIKERL